MVPLIQDEIVDKRKWIDKEDFIDLLALAQSVPGIFAVILPYLSDINCVISVEHWQWL